LVGRVASGIYHGLNPGMGWPLAVSAALMERRGQALQGAGALRAGHLLAMAAILLPFTALLLLVEWQREIQIGAACLVIALGVYLLINPAPSAVSGAGPAVAAGAVVLPRGDGAWRGADAGADLSRHLRTMETDAGHAAAADLMAGNAGIAVAWRWRIRWR
jgi:hypothetical protein